MYRESSLLRSLLINLLRDPYQSKEVLVLIDKPTEMSLDVVKKFRNRVTFILNGERIGKANVLNEAFKHTIGDVLLFLDSDVQLQTNGESFMEILVRDMEDVDILDIKKKIVRGSLLSKLVHYEYLASSLVGWLFSKKIGKCLGLNGAAFAIRREAFQHLGGFRRTLPEDFDLATRSFLGNLSFRYTSRVSVSVKPQSDWRSWYKQRKRWGIATGVWLKDYYRPRTYCGEDAATHAALFAAYASFSSSALPQLSYPLYLLLPSGLFSTIVFGQLLQSRFSCVFSGHIRDTGCKESCGHHSNLCRFFHHIVSVG